MRLPALASTRLGVVLLLTSLACTSPTAPLIEGTWGGDQASLILTPAGGTVQYQCGDGTIDSAWTLSGSGAFAATGQHFFGGGPVPIGGRPPHPAVYTGQVNGSVLTLTVTLEDLADTLGPFRLVRGGPSVTEICL